VAAVGLAGCTADDDTLPVATDWQANVDRPHPPVSPPGSDVLVVGSASPFDDDPLLTGLDPETGDVEWEFTGPENEGSPVGADGRFVYVLSKRAETVLAVGHGGKPGWFADVAPVDEPDPGVVEFAPVPVGGTVVVPVSGTEDDVPDRLVGLDRVDGTGRFVHELPASLSAAPAGAEGGVLVPLLDGTLRRVDIDGGERWTRRVGAAMGPPTVENGVAYLGSARERLHAIDAGTGTERWAAPLENTVFSRPLVGEAVYVGGADFYVTAVGRDGERRWRAELPTAVTHGPGRVGDRLVTLAGGNRRVRGPSGEVPFSPTVLGVHDTDGTTVRTERFEGIHDGGEVVWTAVAGEAAYLGQERRVVRLAPEVLADG
jgi:outer membrane protein assembly factor BamB